MREIDLGEVHIKNAIRIIMEDTEYNQFQKIAEALDIPKSTFQSALDNNSMRMRDLIKVADLFGYTIKLEKK